MGQKLKKLLLFLIVLISSVCAKIFDNDEWYCRRIPGQYRICRRCPTLEESCERPHNERCECEGIELQANADTPLTGGPLCHSAAEGQIWCYVSSGSNCPDKKTSGVASSMVGIWHKTPIRWSAIACNIENQNDDLLYIGNELWEDDKKIKYGELAKKYGGGGFNVDYAEDCQVECYMRHGICGAWSFHSDTKKCHLFSVKSCCNQNNNAEYENGWVSGYICPYCWSTKGECPCSDEFLQLGIKQGFNETMEGKINLSECELNDPQNRDGIPGPLYGGDYGPYGGEYGEGDGTDPCSEWDMKGF